MPSSSSICGPVWPWEKSALQFGRRLVTTLFFFFQKKQPTYKAKQIYNLGVWNKSWLLPSLATHFPAVPEGTARQTILQTTHLWRLEFGVRDIRWLFRFFLLIIFSGVEQPHRKNLTPPPLRAVDSGEIWPLNWSTSSWCIQLSKECLVSEDFGLSTGWFETETYRSKYASPGRQMGEVFPKIRAGFRCVARLSYRAFILLE